jgi:AraC family transcriptional regulator
MSEAWKTLLPLLVHIQANLDGDLSLTVLSQNAGLSPAHFHRLFKAVTGETPKNYVTRLRVERGAFRLLIHETKLVDLAFDCGFHNHETFIRAFRRGFGCAPSEYRELMQKQIFERVERARNAANEAASIFELSATKVVRLRTMRLAFLRHVGPYESAPDTLFDELEQWARRRRVPGPRIWLGIGHDAPIATPPELLRFDAALVVPEPFVAEGRIGYQMLPGGEFAVTTHAGSFDTLSSAYDAIFPRIMTLPDYRFMGLPAIEIYRSAKVQASLPENQTDIYLPVTPRKGVKKGQAYE